VRILHFASGDLWAVAESMLFGLVRAQLALGNAVRVALMNEKACRPNDCAGRVCRYVRPG
jgi:hypothetical protein